MRGVHLSIYSFAALVAAAACGGDSGTFTDAGVEIDARVIDARLMFDRPTVDLGMVVLGETTPAVTLTVTSIGADPTGGLMVTLDGAGYRFTRNTCDGRSLAAGATCELTVVVTPTAAGQVGGGITVAASPGGEIHASLTVLAVNPGELATMPPSVDFGTISSGTTSAPTQIDVKNTGGADTGLILVTLAGADAAEFELVQNGCMGIPLAANQTCPVMVRFRPGALATGVRTATLSAMASPGGTAVTTLTGNAERPAVVAITGSGAFGGVLVGTSATRTLTVTNTGQQVTGPLTITRTGNAAFQVQAGMAGDCVSGTTTLAPMATCAVRVQYTAGVIGPVVGTITASATPGGSAMASLTGTGQRPAQLAGDLNASFGAVEVATLSTGTQVWTIQNTGDQASSVPVLTLANPELVVAANTCTAAIPGGGSCAITLRYRPSTGGARSAGATVAVTGSMVGGTATATGVWRVTVSRTGDAGTVTSNPAGLDCAPPSLTCSALFPPGNLTLQARTSNGSLVHFAAWSGASAGACAAGPDRDCVLTVDSPEAVSARFDSTFYNLAFVTAATFPTNLGGTAPYDAACNAAATAAGINDAAGTAFIAWMSDAGSTALARLGTANGWVRMDSRAVALDKNNLLGTQRILNPVRYTETGADLGETLVMTGTAADGSTAAASHCAGWSVTSGASLTLGNGMGGPTYWGSGATATCSAATYHLLCLMKTYAAGPGAATDFAGKKVWLTNAVYQPSTTGDPDAACNTDRPAGVAMGRALVARTTATAASLLGAATMYVRPDGQEVGTGAELVAEQARAGIWQSGNGTYWSGQAWTGSATISTLAISTSSCGDWVIPTTSGRFTVPGYARRFWGVTLPVMACSNVGAAGPRLMCFEP